MSADRQRIPKSTLPTDVEAFLRKLAEIPAPPRTRGRGRLIAAIGCRAQSVVCWCEATQPGLGQPEQKT